MTHVAKALFCIVTVAFLQGCGGGDASPPQLRYVVDYLPAATPVAPAGNLVVSPFPGDQTIGTKPIANVQLILPGYAPQVLTAANNEPKDNPQLRWVFTMPATFVAGAYPCGTGAYMTQVIATDVTGLTVSKSFELCPGTAYEATASP